MLLKLLILFAAVSARSVLGSYYHGPTAIPHIQHDGYLADTHEVAAAKSAHLATLASQSHGHHGVSTWGYHGPTAAPHVQHDGHIADTHEVAAAKAEHFAAVAEARTHGGYPHYSGASGTQGGYHGPTAVPHVQHDGYIADTHEVAAAKAEHFAAVAEARTHGGYPHYSGASESQGGYHGPTAVPHVQHDGHIADTHEVAAAKAEHFAAVAKARTHGGYPHYSGASGTQGGYNGPLAEPVVLPSGYLADTLEVQHAKHRHLHLVHTSYDRKEISHHYH